MNRELETESINDWQEAQTYNQLARQYLSGENKSLVRKIVRMIPKGQCWRILDVGTGPAYPIIMLAQKVSRIKITAIDLSLAMCSLAKENAAQAGIDGRIAFLQADGKRLPFKDNSFDLGFCNFTLHHLQKPVFLLNELNRVVKGDGVLLVRDLGRPPQILFKPWVWIFGPTDTPLMKKMYSDSLKAAFTYREFQEILTNSEIQGGSLKREFIFNFRFTRKRIR